ncbi:hypothetical protein [Sediminibacter sp. Hel_I_10]|uniref:hypothetical protein n=1 Tax=Sediminibacter sp. Hel_I_10 TaxID=1392490 RepID=UPI00047E13F4|nr:hypothetical protein [Sediminibacter sp. Hel_I_10]
MERIKFLLLFIVLFGGLVSQGQTTDIKGKIIASNDVVGIHIINKTSSRFTITNDEGVFLIPAKLNDTVLVSGIQYEPKEIIIDQIILQTESMTVYLEDNVNLLDEVVVGKILTGNLMTDIENSDAKRDINFYDLGIPGYTGPRKTQSERRLYEAQSGGGIVPLNPILNWISGRTKKIKKQVALERTDIAVRKVESQLSEVLFEIEEIDEQKRVVFFNYVADDPEFMALMKTDNDLGMLEFLTQKLKAFKIQIEEK